MTPEPYPGQPLGEFVKQGLCEMALIVVIGCTVALIATGVHSATSEPIEPVCSKCGCTTVTESINIQASAL